MSGWLEGYVAPITGGGSGLGRAVAERYVAEGAAVVIVGHDTAQLAQTVGSDAHRELLPCRDTAEAARVTSPGSYAHPA